MKIRPIRSLRALQYGPASFIMPHSGQASSAKYCFFAYSFQSSLKAGSKWIPALNCGLFIFGI
jgi:hypothetical protein